MNIQNIIKAAEMAKAKTTSKRWQAAIDKAVKLSGQWLITELATSTVITTESGETYFVTENRCQCRAYELGQPCKHRAYVALQRRAAETEAPAPKRQAVITRSVESDSTGVKYNVVRCNGWLI